LTENPSAVHEEQASDVIDGPEPEVQVSISSTFHVRILRTKFWRQKLQSCVLGLKFLAPKISYEKRVRKTLMRLTAEG